MSAPLFSIYIAIFAALWLWLASRGITRELKGSGRRKWLVGLMGLLVIGGAAGFFATGLSAVGFLRLPSSFQWPAGYVTGVVRMPDGKYVVPLVAAGRVQVYDPMWRFLRGWHVDALGGDFGVASTENGMIEVVTARSQRYYSFTEDGNLIFDKSSSGLRSDIVHSFQAAGSSFVVPTSPFFWIFSSPFLCWAAVAVGAVGIFLTKNFPQCKG